MGSLIVKCYPTKLFANLADHTYVVCGTGRKAWACWGGKTGGTELRRGNGSTNRANAIAGANERGGIKCYLINGVCHQAANRILLPASITVRGARGYDVSEALFGTYGRPRGPLGTCRAPFDQHGGVVGDLPACAEPVPRAAARKTRSSGPAAGAAPDLPQERKYLKGVLGIYAKVGAGLQEPDSASAQSKAPTREMAGSDLERFYLQLFMHKAKFHLGAALDKPMSGRLRDIRLSAGRSLMKLEDWFTSGEMKAAEFVKAFDKETVLFQEAAANAMKVGPYKALFGLTPGDFVVLADPRIVKRAFAEL